MILYVYIVIIVWFMFLIHFSSGKNQNKIKQTEVCMRYLSLCKDFTPNPHKTPSPEDRILLTVVIKFSNLLQVSYLPGSEKKNQAGNQN